MAKKSDLPTPSFSVCRHLRLIIRMAPPSHQAARQRKPLHSDLDPGIPITLNRAERCLLSLHSFDGTAVKTKKHQGIQIPLDAAFAARFMFAAFDATPRFAGRSHGWKWRTVFFDQITKTRGRDLCRFVVVHGTLMCFLMFDGYSIVFSRRFNDVTAHAASCPTLSEHQVMHQTARNQLANLLSDVSRSVVDRAVLSRLIADWMRHHISENDLPVKDYMKHTPQACVTR